MRESIVHMCPKLDWVKAIDCGEYRASSLHTEGFIHCSRPDQVLEVANRYYQGSQDMVLLLIDPEKVKKEVRWEESDGDIFPHIYGVLNLDAVLGIREFIPGEDGIYRSIPRL